MRKTGLRLWMQAGWPFAQENDQPSLTAESVRGARLWDYISESTTRDIYQIILKKVRASGGTIAVPFRCDGPECRRFMEMSVTSLGAGAVEFHSVLLWEEKRPRMDLLDPSFPRTEELLTMCAWCKKVQTVGWVEVEEAVRQRQLFDQPRLPKITRGICPACRTAFESTLQSA